VGVFYTRALAGFVRDEDAAADFAIAAHAALLHQDRLFYR